MSTLRSLCWLVIGCLLAAGCGSASQPVVEVSVDNSGVATEDSPPLESAATDWPAWRGPNGDGIAADQDLPLEWSGTKNVVWNADVPGRGHSSPIVGGDAVYLATADEEAQTQSVLAFDRKTGAVRWERVLHTGKFVAQRSIHSKGTHANSTVAYDGKAIYAVMLNADAITVSAVDLAGALLWQKKLGDFDSKFGYAPSPILYKSWLIVAADNWGSAFIAAVNRADGKIAWLRKRANTSTYSSPLLATIAGKEQLVISGNQTVCSYDPATGESLWEAVACAEATCGTVVTDGQHVFASGGYPQSITVCINGDGSGAEVWSHRTKIYEPSLLYHNGHLYGVTDKGIAYSWDAKTGDVNWQERLGGSFSASPILCNGLVYVSNLEGETFVFKASAESYDQVAKNTLGSDIYSSPAVSEGQLFLRIGYQTPHGRKEKLYCLGKTPATPASPATSE